MDVTPYVRDLGREFTALAEAGGDEARALAERLAAPLEPAIRMTLLDALSAAAGEITRELAPGSVEVRLRGRDADFVVTLPSAGAPGSRPGDATSEEEGDGAAADGGAAAGGPGRLLTAEEGPAARINVRLPEQLKTAIEEAAAREGRSVNAWLVRAAAAALQGTGRDQRSEPGGSGKRARQRFTGWVQ